MDYVHRDITPQSTKYRLHASTGDRLFVDAWARLGSTSLTPIRVADPTGSQSPEIHIRNMAEVWCDEAPVIRSQSTGLLLDIAGSVAHGVEGLRTRAAILLDNGDEAGMAVNATVNVTGTVEATGWVDAALWLNGGGNTVTIAGTLSNFAESANDVTHGIVIRSQGSAPADNLISVSGILVSDNTFFSRRSMAVLTQDDADTLVNTGRITGHVSLGDGNDTLTNDGTLQGNVRMGEGDDQVTITGTVEGVVDLGAGNDTFVIATGGSITSAFGDPGTVVGGSGDDRYVLTSGNIVIVERANGGYDRIDGWADATLVGTQVEDLFLKGGDDLNGRGHSGAHRLVGNAGANSLWGGGGDDRLDGGLGGDRLVGQGGNDTIVGGGDDDLIYGGDGNDRLQGDVGDDHLFGGDGDDLVNGGAGADIQFGGAGLDVFVFASDSGGTGLAVDVIRDFVQGEDRIRLIGTGATWRGDQGFTGTANEVRYVQSANKTMVLVDTTADGIADLALRLDGSFALTTDDLQIL